MIHSALASALAAGAIAVAIPHPRGVQTLLVARNVVLVHGLFADGSSWSEVIARLQAAGLNVTSVQNPLTTLDDAVQETPRVLAREPKSVTPTRRNRSTIKYLSWAPGLPN